MRDVGREPGPEIPKSPILASQNPPWFRCPNPSGWRAHQDGGIEEDLLAFLTALVQFLKPQLILETGTYYGTSAIALARGCVANGFGYVHTLEIDGDRVKEANRRITKAGLGEWVLVHEAASIPESADSVPLFSWVFGLIDLMFVDGNVERWKEIRRFERYLSARALVVAHDAADPDSGYDTLTDYHRVEIGSPTGLAILQRRR